MDVTLRFYDACDMKMFREHEYENMDDVTVSFVKGVVDRSLKAFEIVIPYIVSRQYIGDNDYVFNIIFDGSCIPAVFGIHVLDDIAYLIKSVIVCHCS